MENEDRRRTRTRRRLPTLVAIAIAATGVAHAAGQGEAELLVAPEQFEHRTGTDNPLSVESGFDPQGAVPYTAFGDVDGDGDVDLVVGEVELSNGTGSLSYYENTGTPNAPVFVKQTGSHPLAGPAAAIASRQLSYIFPVLSDVDADDDLDLLVGADVPENNDEGRQFVLFFRNDSAVDAPVFTYVQEPSNPFAALSADSGYFDPGSSAVGGVPTVTLPELDSALAVADLSGDGSPDVVTVGPAVDSWIHYYPNAGDATTPSFGDALVTPADGNPYPLTDERHLVGGYSRLTLVDLDLDGDEDTVVGFSPDPDGATLLRYFTNDGTATSPSFSEDTGTHPVSEANQVQDLSELLRPQPAFTDVDADGDYDLFVSGSVVVNQEAQSRVLYFENVGAFYPSAAEQGATNLPGQSVLVASNKFAGWVYIARDDVAPQTASALESARSDGLAARAPVTRAMEPIEVPTEGLEEGTYFAYVVDGAGVLSTEVGVNALTVTDPSAVGEDSSYAWIESVTIGTVTNQSGNDDGYAAFADPSPSAAPGDEITIRIEPGFNAQHRAYVRRAAQHYVAVWLDVDESTTYDADERLLLAGPGWRPFEETITIPQDASPGSTVGLRIVMQFHENGEPTPAGTIPFGEVEDYAFTITQ